MIEVLTGLTGRSTTLHIHSFREVFRKVNRVLIEVLVLLQKGFCKHDMLEATLL